MSDKVWFERFRKRCKSIAIYFSISSCLSKDKIWRLANKWRRYWRKIQKVLGFIKADAASCSEHRRSPIWFNRMSQHSFSDKMKHSGVCPPYAAHSVLSYLAFFGYAMQRCINMKCANWEKLCLLPKLQYPYNECSWRNIVEKKERKIKKFIIFYETF